MNDTPPTDKKPRRKSAPRKRSASKRTTKSSVEAKATSGRNEVDAGSSPLSLDAGGDSVASVDASAVARVLDPAPMADAVSADDASRSDARPVDDGLRSGERASVVTDGQVSGDASTSSVDGDVPSTRLQPDDGPRPEANTRAPVERLSGLPADGSAEARPAPATSERPIGASPVHAQDHSATTTPPVPQAASLRQPSLRPGELIRVPLSVRWRDLDAFNHVNNSKYLSYLEEARLRWMLTVPGMGLDDDVAPVVAASNLNYKRPIGWPGDVVVELFVERVGNTSVTIGHRIVDAAEGGVTYCDGQVVMVWIDRTSGRAAPLPAGVRAACSRR